MTRPADLGCLVKPPAFTLWRPPRAPGTALAGLRAQPPPRPPEPPRHHRDPSLIMPDIATLARVLQGLWHL